MTRLPDDNSELEPPDPIPNSEVKQLSADGSVGFPHVRVGHCQALFEKPGFERIRVFFDGENPRTWSADPAVRGGTSSDR